MYGGGMGMGMGYGMGGMGMGGMGGYGMGGMGGMGGGYGMNRFGNNNYNNNNNFNNNNNNLNGGQNQNGQPGLNGNLNNPQNNNGAQPSPPQANKTQLLLSGIQEVSQAFVSLLEVSTQFAILAVTASCTYAQLQQANNMPQMMGPMGQMGQMMPQPTQLPAEAAKSAAGGTASWLSKNLKRQLITLFVGTAIYLGLMKVYKRYTRALAANSKPTTRDEGEIDYNQYYDDDSVEIATESTHGDSLAIALYPYSAENDDEMSFQQRDVLKIHKHDGNWWLASLLSDPTTTGLIPSNRVEFVNKNKI